MFRVLGAGLALVASCGDRTVASGEGEGDTGSGGTSSQDDGGTDGGSATGGKPTTTGGGSDSTDDSGDTWEPDMPDVNGGGGWCDIWAQDCPPGDKCMPWAYDGGDVWNALKCSPLDPDPRQPGDECTAEGSGVSGIDDCALGSMCWDVDPETVEGYCIAFCQGSEDDPLCSDPNSYCVIFNSGVLPLCLAWCDPLLQDCDHDTICVVAPDDQAFVCLGHGSGEDNYGDPCEYASHCGTGLFCAEAAQVPGCQGAVGCCTEYCDLTAPVPTDSCSGADQGVECIPWFEPGQAPDGYDHVGKCILPP
jgi:hypothetical protein